MTTLSVPVASIVPLVSRPPALEPPATPMFGPAGRPPATVFPELPFPDLTAGPGPRLAVTEPDAFAPEPTSRAALPDPALHARRLVLAALEAVGGRRPARQLLPYLTESAYQHLVQRLHRGLTTTTTGSGSASRKPGAVTVLGPTPRAPGTPDHRPTSRTRIHVGRAVICEPADGIVEATVLARWGARTVAVAIRLEGVDGRWRCPILAIL